MNFLKLSLLSLALLIARPAVASEEYKQIVSGLLGNVEKSTNSLAVVGFSYSDGRDSKDGVVIAERLATELVKINKFTVVERKELEKVLQELKLHRSGLIDPSSSKDIGKMLGASTVVLGTLTEVSDNNIELHVRAVEVETGKIIAAITEIVRKDWLEQYRENLAEETRAIEKNPKDAQAFYNRAITNYDLGEYEKAIADFGIAITINPVYRDAYYNRGGAYMRDGNNDKAIEDYAKAIQLKEDWQVYLDRGVAYARAGKYDKALSDFIKAISLNPKQPLSYYNRGRTFMTLDDYDNAILDFSKVLSLDPGYPLPARYTRGVAYYNKGYKDRALIDFNDVIREKPNSADAYYYRGMIYLYGKKDSPLDRPTQGIADLSKAIEISPQLSSAYKERGIGYMMMNDNAKAAVDLTKAIELNPRDASAYNQRAMAYTFGKEPRKALADFAAAVELDPSLRPTVQMWVNMNAALIQ